MAHLVREGEREVRVGRVGGGEGERRVGGGRGEREVRVGRVGGGEGERRVGGGRERGR